MSAVREEEKQIDRALTLRSAEFRRAREDGWLKLDAMVAKAERGGIGALSAVEAREIATLYSSAVSSLSVARSIALDRNLLLYLENLTLRAYLVVYGPRTGVLESMSDFFARGWPAAVRALRRHILIMAVIFAASAAAGFMMVRSDVGNYNLIMPASMVQGRTPDSTREELRETLFADWPGFSQMFIDFANFLFRHNSRVGILSFGLGFMLGVPAIMLEAYNGLMLGAFIALYARHGLAIDVIGWLSIHGVTEILAFILMGAGGLAIAENILFPGRLPRLENLRRGGRKAATVAVGGVFMLFIAGIIEGGFRQLIAHTGGRFAFAAVTAAWWAWYFTFAGDEGHADER
jgi:uncharacterized membrane protein SpoIIM required for sporulation